MKLIEYDGMTPIEVLNHFRNCYYTAGIVTENGVVANALNEALPAIAAQRWIPVTERLPEKGGDYLCNCYIDNNKEYPFFMVLRYFIYEELPHFQHESSGLSVTHWMEIPQVPKDGDT